MFTETQKKAADERRQLFVSEVFYISDASEAETKASGWGTKGKIEWLKSACTHYRKDMHKILGD